MKKIFLYLFVIVSTGDIVSILSEMYWLETICKPAIMITLGVYYWTSQKEKQEAVAGTVLLAIVFSCLGDTLLMLQKSNPNYFMFGLGSFLVAHIFYIFAYRQHQGEDSADELQGLQKIRFALPVVLSGTGLVVILYNHLGDLRIPVLVYAAVLTYMVLTALFRFGKTNTGSFTMVFGGAILFMISDSLIAISKFLEPISMGGFWIMTTYISAQFLIVRGLIRHE
ncbi:MAG TPA: lysoplasmalogenase [Cyclobacteriaceae bacterium]